MVSIFSHFLYKLDKNKINDEEYLSKVKTIQDKLNEIEKDFK